MTTPAFVHLRMHSEYSIVDGIVRLDVEEKRQDKEGNTFKAHVCPPVERARADGMPALALTDLGNLFGMVKFYKAARGAGIKPVIGADVWLTNETSRDQPHRCRDKSYSAAIEAHHGMEKSVLKLQTRAALAGYALRRWSVDCSPDHHLPPNEHHLWLRNTPTLYGVESAVMAPGYAAG